MQDKTQDYPPSFVSTVDGPGRELCSNLSLILSSRVLRGTLYFLAASLIVTFWSRTALMAAMVSHAVKNRPISFTSCTSSSQQISFFLPTILFFPLLIYAQPNLDLNLDWRTHSHDFFLFCWGGGGGGGVGMTHASKT